MQIWRKTVDCLATGFYLGKMPKAPGTFGTFLGIPVAYAMALAGGTGYMVLAIALLFFASWIAGLHERYTNAHDPGEIVIDEVVGFVIAMTWLPLTWQSFAFAFALFRLFDIWKPYPIRAIDQRVGGGLGTVLDDVAAGLVANVFLQMMYTHTSWLGVQLALQ